MNDEIVIRIPYRVLRELLATQDASNESQAPPDEPAEAWPWSDKQKRFLYRLLQRLGYEGDTAKQYITTALRLNGEPPTRRQASELIDRLQAELGRNEKGGARGAA